MYIDILINLIRVYYLSRNILADIKVTIKTKAHVSF